MVKLADTRDLKSLDRNIVPVRVRLPALKDPLRTVRRGFFFYVILSKNRNKILTHKIANSIDFYTLNGVI